MLFSCFSLAGCLVTVLCFVFCLTPSTWIMAGLAMFISSLIGSWLASLSPSVSLALLLLFAYFVKLNVVKKREARSVLDFDLAGCLSGHPKDILVALCICSHNYE